MTVTDDVAAIIALAPNGVYSRVLFVGQDVYGSCMTEPDEFTLAIHAFRGVKGGWWLQLHEGMFLDGRGMTSYDEGRTLVEVNAQERLPVEVEALHAIITLRVKELRDQHEIDARDDADESERVAA